MNLLLTNHQMLHKQAILLLLFSRLQLKQGNDQYVMNQLWIVTNLCLGFLKSRMIVEGRIYTPLRSSYPLIHLCYHLQLFLSPLLPHSSSISSCRAVGSCRRSKVEVSGIVSFSCCHWRWGRAPGAAPVFVFFSPLFSCCGQSLVTVAGSTFVFLRVGYVIPPSSSTPPFFSSKLLPFSPSFYQHICQPRARLPTLFLNSK